LSELNAAFSKNVKVSHEHKIITLILLLFGATFKLLWTKNGSLKPLIFDYKPSLVKSSQLITFNLKNRLTVKKSHPTNVVQLNLF
jgi:hypothetical protein